MRKAKPSIHYVDNKKFYTEMVKYITKINEAKEAGLPKEEWPRVTNYIGKSILDIATRLSTAGNFSSYTFRDEMVNDAVENCLMYIHNFNPDKSKNPFAYFTQISYFAFIRRIKKEQKHQYIRQKFMIDSITMNNIVDMSAEDGAHFNAMHIDLGFNAEKYQSFVDKFESTNNVKKKPKKGLENFIEDTDDKSSTDNRTDDRSGQGQEDS